VADRLKGFVPNADVLHVDAPRRGLRRLASAGAVLLVAVLLGQGVPGLAAADSVAAAREDADRLRTELADLRDRSAAAIARLEQAEYEVGLAVGRSATLTTELDAAKDEAGGTDRQLSRRVSALYRSGGTLGMWASLLEARDPADFAARKINVDKVVASDARLRTEAQDGAGRVAVLEEEARQVTSDKIRATAVAEAQAAELGDLLARQQLALGRADAKVRQLVEEERRRAAAAELARLAAEQEAAARARAAALAAEQAAAQAAAPPGTPGAAVTSRLRPGVGSDPGRSTDVYIGPAGSCPLGPVHSFTDTWHAPRSGGRKHQGQDLFAPYGAPAYAVVDGVIERWSNGKLGGIALWLRGNDGTRYYYAHNVSNVAQPGARVRAGQLVAYVGTTGNAATTPPHIHFEAHPPSAGGARNPYPWLRALCG
jgi:peptidoglycan LD-endopeptidase LytH